MDHEKSVSATDLGTLGLYFPLPYRIATILLAGERFIVLRISVCGV